MLPTENFLMESASQIAHSSLDIVKEGEEAERGIKRVTRMCCFSQEVLSPPPHYIKLGLNF